MKKHVVHLKGFVRIVVDLYNKIWSRTNLVVNNKYFWFVTNFLNYLRQMKDHFYTLHIK